MNDVLNELVGMSAELGAPAHDLAILGEGNTSARMDEETFWVKASGIQLGRAGRDGFVRVRSAPILEAMDGPSLDDTALRELLKAATVEGQRLPRSRPSCMRFACDRRACSSLGTRIRRPPWVCSADFAAAICSPAACFPIKS